MSLNDDLAKLIKGDVSIDPIEIVKHSRDTSIFERRPQVIVYPKDPDDVAAVIKYVRSAKKSGKPLSLAARSAGTDMSGGPLTDGIALSFTKYMNRMLSIGPDYAIAEPGMYYRDFEKETLQKTGSLLPSYPASRELCAIGGIVSNNSGGELTLEYGKTEKYVEELEVILSDGSRITTRRLSMAELAQKEAGATLEAEIYRKVHALISMHRETIAAARPKVSKNSAGYALWNVFDEATQTFDLGQLIVGSQGTLGIVTKARLKLVKLKPHRAMMVMFLSDVHLLPEVVKRVLAHNPESFESYDDHTFKLAVRFLPQIVRQLGFIQMLQLGLAFLPELFMVLRGGVPKLVLMTEFSDETPEYAHERAVQALTSLRNIPIKARLTRSAMDSRKYWIIRRESFALLRKNLHGFYASPFIDDMVVPPESYPEFLPELNALIMRYELIYTIAGHVGNGNFHIIPLMNLSDPKARETIMELTPKVYELVHKYGGSTTGEHNDGIIRTPYIRGMFGDDMTALFKEVKNIFDPLNILNPGKKVGGTVEDIHKYMITQSGPATVAK